MCEVSAHAQLPGGVTTGVQPQPQLLAQPRAVLPLYNLTFNLSWNYLLGLVWSWQVGGWTPGQVSLYYTTQVTLTKTKSWILCPERAAIYPRW